MFWKFEGINDITLLFLNMLGKSINSMPRARVINRTK